MLMFLMFVLIGLVIGSSALNLMKFWEYRPQKTATILPKQQNRHL